MSVMTEDQARALFDALVSVAASDSMIGQDLIVAIETQGATPSPAAVGQIHDTTGDHLSILVESGATINYVPIGWDVIESIALRVKP